MCTCLLCTQLNGVATTMPYEYINGSDSLQVKIWGRFHHLSTALGLEVFYDGRHYVGVRLSSSYKAQVCGLCGNMDDERRNDFQMPNGTMADDPASFGNSWKIYHQDDRYMSEI